MAPRYVMAKREKLTGVEIRILRLVASGHTNAEIGEQLGFSEEVVKRYLRTLRFVLGARDRAHAVHRGWECGYLGREEQQVPPRVVSSVSEGLR
jgi:DNA-binding CsgD family transcriptional regulator